MKTVLISAFCVVILGAFFTQNTFASTVACSHTCPNGGDVHWFCPIHFPCVNDCDCNCTYNEQTHCLFWDYFDRCEGRLHTGVWCCN